MVSWHGDPNLATPEPLNGGGGLLWALPLALSCCPREFAFHLKKAGKKKIIEKSVKG